MDQKSINKYKRKIMFAESKSDCFRSIKQNNQGAIFLHLNHKLQSHIISKLSMDEITKFLHFLDPDEVTDILQHLPKLKSNKIIKKLNENKRKKVEFLLKFNPQSAAGLMNLDYIEIEKHTPVSKIIQTISKHEKRTGKFPTILVVQDGFLLGEVPGHILPLLKGQQLNKWIKKIHSLKYDANENDVIDAFKKHPHNKIVVLDEDDSILGVIYSDDILKLIHHKQSRSLTEFAGVSDEEDVLDSAFVKVHNRYKWLILNLFTAFLAAWIISLFQDTITSLVLLAVYMPIVAGMGGNAGTQTLAVVVRGITLKEIDSISGKKVIWNEVIAGAINGIIVGAIVAGVATFWNHSPVLGLIIGISMIVNLIISGFFGTIVPLIMKRLGKDPATSATIFITTATDVCGFFVFLGLASLLL